jgi:hypothetical protein
MGADSPDGFDLPDFGDASDDPAEPRSRVAVEERDRFEYWDDLRAAVAADAWEMAAERFRRQWTSHCGRWAAAPDAGDAGGTSADRSADPPGSWRGDGGRYLDAAANAEVEKRCDGIAEVERDVVSPAMCEIEACDPERRLVGFDHRLKGLDRIKEKVAADVLFKSRTPEQALANVKDPVRYTFQYGEAAYAEAVHADIGRLKERGFEQVELRNSWAAGSYRGINSRWREPVTGQLFEVQFHTRTSYEAKQLTHAAYERLRNPETSDSERNELEELQERVCRHIPIPRNATGVTDFP